MDDKRTETLSTDAKLEGMLDKVRRQTEAECERIERDAQQEADDIIRQAFADARAKVSDAIRHERRTMAREVQKAEAAIDTDRRQRLQNAEHSFLREAWEAMEAVILERWKDDGQRRQWIEAAVHATEENLQPGSWRIEHPGGWNTDELQPFVNVIEEQSGEGPAFDARDDIQAGLRIKVGEAVLDATDEGILAERNYVSALMLAEVFKELEAAQDDAQKETQANAQATKNEEARP